MKLNITKKADYTFNNALRLMAIMNGWDAFIPGAPETEHADEYIQAANKSDDKVAIVLISKIHGFWVLLRESGDFSTLSVQENIKGTFEECIYALQKEFGEVK